MKFVFCMHNAYFSILTVLLFVFFTGVHGYSFLRSTGYPIPTSRTLTYRFESYKISPGVLDNLLEPFLFKISSMDTLDRYCVMSIDKMAINVSEDYDPSKKQFMCFVSLDNKENLGTHLLAVLIRGIRKPWKQIVAIEITDSSTKATDMIYLIYRSVRFVRSCGLCVLSVTSDMGRKNISLWSKLGVHAKKNGDRVNTFSVDEDNLFVIPDVCHLMKNLRSAVQSHDLVLSESIKMRENLSSPLISGKYIQALWTAEISGNKAIRSLHQLRPEDIDPSDFEKMNVASALRYISEKTANAIEMAIELKCLPEEARTTAWFLRKMSLWFELVSSRIRKKGITRNNKESKKQLLVSVIEIMQNIEIGGGNTTWKPLNKGIILASLSLLDISELLLRNDYFNLILFHGFNQDALENVFSQIRKKYGLMPKVS